MRIALLGNTQAQAERLSRLLPFAHELIKVPPTSAPDAPPLEVDAAVGIRFGAEDARRVRCRLLQVSGAGLDAIALDAVANSTSICNVYEHEIPIAEYVMLAVLEHRIGFFAMAKGFRNETWSATFQGRKPHGEAAGTSLGLIGFGHIGKAVAVRAKAFGMRVHAVTRSGRALPEADWSGSVALLDEMLASVDVVVIACPLSEETRGLIDRRRLALMKKHALLINIARGDVVVEEDLYRALEEGMIGGAVLDAWYRYPDASGAPVAPSRFRFDELPNVYCTPHAAGWTDALMERRYRFIAENLTRLHRGEPLENVVRAGASPVRIFTASSSATAPVECSGHVLVSGSYGGEYNAWHAARRHLRGVVLNDAGVGKDGAGVSGLPYLDGIGLPAATADAMTCHIADGEHMLAHGTISHVNRAAAALGCAPGQSVRECAQRMAAAPIVGVEPPPIAGGKRYVISDKPGEPKVLCLDAAPLLQPEDAGAIVVTGSHAALFRGQPDNIVGPDVGAIFFNDAGVGLDQAGIGRLADLDRRAIPAGAVAAATAPIGNSRAIYEDGVLSHVNAAAAGLGARAGMRLKDFVAQLLVKGQG
jgi:phosphoglycerate dehydrogenase-like enzyme